MSFASTLNFAGKPMTGNTIRTQNGNSFHTLFLSLSFILRFDGVSPGVSECSHDFH